jgi:hypothetical protein
MSTIGGFPMAFVKFPQALSKNGKSLGAAILGFFSGLWTIEIFS